MNKESWELEVLDDGNDFRIKKHTIWVENGPYEEDDDDDYDKDDDETLEEWLSGWKESR